jgi:hypothetical protein
MFLRFYSTVSSSVSDPGSGSGFNQVSGSVSGSRRAKITHKNGKHFDIFSSCFEIAIFDKKISFFSPANFFNFWSSKT